MVGLRLVGILMLLSITASAQKSDDSYKEVMTSDTTLNKFMLYWLRKPYKFGGNSEKGIDCSQFTKRLYKDVYGLLIGDIAEEQYDQTERIKRDSLRVGDLIFFKSKASPSGWHCGAYIGNTYFIHASNKYEGVKISSLKEPRYTKSIKGYGRYSDTLIKKYESIKISIDSSNSSASSIRSVRSKQNNQVSRRRNKSSKKKHRKNR